MAINLHAKYEKKLAEAYTRSSFVAGNASSEFEFTGVKSIKIPSIVTKPLGDYDRTPNNEYFRYGTPADVQDTVQEMSMTQDKSFALVVDKGDNSEQQLMKNAGTVMKAEIEEQVVPHIDKYVLAKWCNEAGMVKTFASALTKTTVVSAILDAETYFSDNFVPDGERYLYIKSDQFSLLRLAPEWTGCDKLTKEIVKRGYIGDIASFKVIRVPASYLPAGVYFLAVQKKSVLAPQKIRDAKVHQDPPGISGALLEGRYNFDAFVIGARCSGVYVACAEDNACAEPAATKGATTSLATETAGASIKYTLDGSDPRYSASAAVYTGAFANPDAGVVIKAYAYKTGLLPSTVLTHTCV
ncbi:MAG: hypothetical protein BWY11_00131 [Firmicutes bacterium ADurb.Bin182]|nr:MAG: hypothetical protein BWY11_00131 [Firmicutes bacterium ADurb.Bin182]